MNPDPPRGRRACYPLIHEELKRKLPKSDCSHRKACFSISVSSQCTKSVILLLHLVMALDFSPKEFVHVPRNPNLKWIWTGGELSSISKFIAYTANIFCAKYTDKCLCNKSAQGSFVLLTDKCM